MRTDDANQRVPDWDKIRDEFTGTINPLRQIAGAHGITEVAVRKRAKRDGWKRPEGAARRKLRMPVTLTPTASPVSEAEAAASEPEAIVDRGRNIAARLLDELEATTTHIGQIEEAIEEATKDDSSGKRRAAMYSAVSLAMRSTIAKNIALAVKTLNDAATAGGKKARAQEAAKAVGSTRFITPPGPKLVVDNR